MSQVRLMNPFNPKEFDPSQGAGSLPVGRHKVIMESASVEANKANTGGFLQANLKVIEGEFAGAGGADRMNLYHQNAKVVEIANRRLSAYCHVTGQFQLGSDGTDVSVLFNIPFYIEVGNQKLTDEQEAAKARGEQVTPYTEIKKLFDINGNEPGKGGGQAAPQQQAAAGWGGNQQQQQPAQNQQQPQPQQAAGWGQQEAQQQPQQQAQPEQQQQVQQQQQPAWGGAQQQQPAQQQNAGWQQQQQQPAQQQQAPWGAKS